MNVKQQIEKAKTQLVLDEPFFASIALRLPLKEDPSCKTTWVDGIQIGYNPSFIKQLSLDETKGLIAHEVMHVVSCHHLRRQHREHRRWNEACDYAINDILLLSGFKLPRGALKGKGTEEYSESIYEKLSSQQQQQQGQSQQQQGQQGQQGQDSDPGNCGEVRDMPGKDGGKASEAEVKEAEANVKIMVKQAAQSAKAAGRFPAGAQKLIEELTDPKIDYKEVLRRFVDQAAKNDYAWMPPNKRYIHMGLYLPSLHSQELKMIAVGVDTSGSAYDEKTFAEIGGELTGMIEAYNSTAYVMYADVDLQSVEEFSTDNLPLVLNAKGGGGTSFVAPFKHLEDQNMNPACMIYLTDGQCYRFPEIHPEYPVLWIILGRWRKDNFNPPFGEVLYT
ncbi:MAG: VWA-like domain-containing protein [Bacteriovoracaceae bacterium]